LVDDEMEELFIYPKLKEIDRFSALAPSGIPPNLAKRIKFQT
jgi:hypothetical protein